MTSRATKITTICKHEGKLPSEGVRLDRDKMSATGALVHDWGAGRVARTPPASALRSESPLRRRLEGRGLAPRSFDAYSDLVDGSAVPQHGIQRNGVK